MKFINKLSVRHIALSVFFMLLLFSEVTTETNAAIGSEILGHAYGFPFPWHMAGPTSLSRVVFVPQLLLSLGVYSIVSLVIVAFCVWAARSCAVPKWARRTLAGTVVGLSLASMLVFSINFIQVEFWWRTDTAALSFSGVSIHFGPEFSRLHE